jgi:competence protein ComEA
MKSPRALVYVMVGVTLAFRVLAQSPGSQTASLARERESLAAVCGVCHTLELVLDTPMDLDAWHETVQKMVDQGAMGTDDQFDDIMDYLHRTMTTININNAPFNELQTVLDVTPDTARAIVARRDKHTFADLKDVESAIPRTERDRIESKARLIFFR